MDGSIKILRQLKQVFEPYCVMLKELKGEERHSSNQNVSGKKRKILKVQ
jgi:hypothetical protein